MLTVKRIQLCPYNSLRGLDKRQCFIRKDGAVAVKSLVVNAYVAFDEQHRLNDGLKGSFASPLHNCRPPFAMYLNNNCFSTKQNSTSLPQELMRSIFASAVFASSRESGRELVLLPYPKKPSILFFRS